MARMNSGIKAEMSFSALGFGGPSPGFIAGRRSGGVINTAVRRVNSWGTIPYTKNL